MNKLMRFLPICFCETKQLTDTFDTNLESSFSKFLEKTFGKEKAIETVEKYWLGNLNGDVVFWQLDRDKTIRYWKGYGLRRGWEKETKVSGLDKRIVN